MSDVARPSPVEITRAEWKKTPADDKCIENGRHFMMRATEKGTRLVQVVIMDEQQEAAALADNCISLGLCP